MVLIVQIPSTESHYRKKFENPSMGSFNRAKCRLDENTWCQCKELFSSYIHLLPLGMFLCAL